MNFSFKEAALAATIAACTLFPAKPSMAQKMMLPRPDMASAMDSVRTLARKDSAKPKIKPYKEVIPSTARTSYGFFFVHKVDDKYLLEIPDSLLGRDLLVVNRIVRAATGATPAKTLFGGAFSYAGDEIGQNIIRFQKLTDDKIFLQTISFGERSSDSSSNGLHRNLMNSNIQPILAAFPIKAVNEARKTEVIDLTDFINSDNPVLYFPSEIKTFLGITNIAPERSYIDHIQAFPMNIEIRTLRTYNSAAGPLATQPPRTYELNSSIVLLPETPMRGRPSDPRVGFFTDQYVDFDANPQGVRREGNIWRWRMEPRSEDMDKYLRGELVEPAHPIVIYIDPLTPRKWVPYLIQGINDWQAAFEKAGFCSAIIGKEAPSGDSTWSMEDARHSVLVYKPSDIENASGPSVRDPRSGEILETHINWYHNVMDRLYKWYFVQAATNDPRARKPQFDDSLMGELVRFVSSHEVGHTLGLMHNFGASSTVPVENLRNKAWVDAHGHTPSIMDYARFNYVAQPEDSIDERGLFPRIGDYDKWAIRWGYRYLPPSLPVAAEKDTLNRWIVDKLVSGPQYFYGAQLNPLDPMSLKGGNPDPRDQSEDLGDDAMKAGEYGIRNLKRIEPRLLEWTREPHEDYTRTGEMYGEVVNQYERYMGHVLKNIGGLLITPKTTDQSGPVFAYSSREKQQRAVAFLHAQLFTTPAWLIDQRLFGLATIDFSSVAKVQKTMIVQLLDPGRLDRLLSQQTYEPAKAYTPDQFLHDLEQGIFSEEQTHKSIDQYRRNLQKMYVESLVALLPSPDGKKSGVDRDGDLISILKMHAKHLCVEMKEASLRAPDAATRGHLEDLYERLTIATRLKEK